MSLDNQCNTWWCRECYSFSICSIIGISILPNSDPASKSVLCYQEIIISSIFGTFYPKLPRCSAFNEIRAE